MSSDISPPTRRQPRQQRGEQRLAAMLDAAAAEFAQAGYDAATMTAIARRCGSSIGALYQYFPNKLALAHALRERYGEEMGRRWTVLTAEAAQLGVAALVERIFGLMVGFFEEHPAYFTLLGATLDYQRNAESRQRLRERFGAVFREIQPALGEDEALLMAKVSLQIVKGLNPLYAEADAQERLRLAAEFKLALAGYLETRLR
ncbi:TetR/AcrR family transcriptional regulator [Oxalobacteraceae bacterium A2-2]